MENLQATITIKQPKVFRGMVAFDHGEREALWKRRKSWKHSDLKRMNRELEKSLPHS